MRALIAVAFDGFPELQPSAFSLQPFCIDGVDGVDGVECANEFQERGCAEGQPQKRDQLCRNIFFQRVNNRRLRTPGFSFRTLSRRSEAKTDPHSNGFELPPFPLSAFCFVFRPASTLQLSRRAEASERRRLNSSTLQRRRQALIAGRWRFGNCHNSRTDPFTKRIVLEFPRVASRCAGPTLGFGTESIQDSSWSRCRLCCGNLVR